MSSLLFTSLWGIRVALLCSSPIVWLCRRGLRLLFGALLLWASIGTIVYLGAWFSHHQQLTQRTAKRANVAHDYFLLQQITKAHPTNREGLFALSAAAWRLGEDFVVARTNEQLKLLEPNDPRIANLEKN